MDEQVPPDSPPQLASSLQREPESREQEGDDTRGPGSARSQGEKERGRRPRAPRRPRRPEGQTPGHDKQAAPGADAHGGTTRQGHEENCGRGAGLHPGLGGGSKFHVRIAEGTDGRLWALGPA